MNQDFDEGLAAVRLKMALACSGLWGSLHIMLKRLSCRRLRRAEAGKDPPINRTNDLGVPL